MNRIKFSKLWDKLDDPVFTTIRSWNRLKEDYYVSNIGKEFQVCLVKDESDFENVTRLFNAYLTDVKPTTPDKISMDVLERDVTLGGIVEETWLKRVQHYQSVLVLTFSKAPPDKSRIYIVEQPKPPVQATAQPVYA